jgi:hypothetical protein
MDTAYDEHCSPLDANHVERVHCARFRRYHRRLVAADTTGLLRRVSAQGDERSTNGTTVSRDDKEVLAIHVPANGRA